MKKIKAPRLRHLSTRKKMAAQLSPAYSLLANI
jgi:hypothetical protein